MTDQEAHELRDKIARAIHDTQCEGCVGWAPHGNPVKDKYRLLADAVMPIVEAETEALRNALTWYRTCFNIANAQSDTETQP